MREGEMDGGMGRGVRRGVRRYVVVMGGIGRGWK